MSMYRSMFQIYVKGSLKAVEFYKKAFGAKTGAVYPNDDETAYIHAELDVFGQVLAVSETQEDSVPGNTMQFCLHIGEYGHEIVKSAYEVLKTGAEIHDVLGECPFSPLMFSLIDKFGVNWCIFV